MSSYVQDIPSELLHKIYVEVLKRQTISLDLRRKLKISPGRLHIPDDIKARLVSLLEIKQGRNHQPDNIIGDPRPWTYLRIQVSTDYPKFSANTPVEVLMRAPNGKEFGCLAISGPITNAFRGSGHIWKSIANDDFGFYDVFSGQKYNLDTFELESALWKRDVQPYTRC